MAKESLNSPEFQARRAEGRARAGELQGAFEDRGDALGWFDALYRAAGDDVAHVPWADMAPHPGLSEWLDDEDEIRSGTVLDIGSGLGDNAEALAARGYDVTAFDLSERAVAWAKKRFENSKVDYYAADLFAPPDAWIGGFELVHECYTVQALKGEWREKSFEAIAAFVAPGGRLLIHCRSRGNDEEVQGPPWPVSRRELAGFERAGLALQSLETYEVQKDRMVAHFRAIYAAPLERD